MQFKLTIDIDPNSMVNSNVDIETMLMKTMVEFNQATNADWDDEIEPIKTQSLMYCGQRVGSWKIVSD
jgi:hypothetical protein